MTDLQGSLGAHSVRNLELLELEDVELQEMIVKFVEDGKEREVLVTCMVMWNYHGQIRSFLRTYALEDHISTKL